MTSDETRIQILANWPMSHAKRVTRDNWKNPEYHVIAALRNLRTDTNSPKPGRFYTIPKIHKQGHPGRPIVSSNSHPTERISQFVDHHLQPLVTKLPSYIKDTTHFLKKLNSIGQLPNGVLLVTLDVASLYTNIPHNDGIQASGNETGSQSAGAHAHCIPFHC